MRRGRSWWREDRMPPKPGPPVLGKYNILVVVCGFMYPVYECFVFHMARVLVCAGVLVIGGGGIRMPTFASTTFFVNFWLRGL